MGRVARPSRRQGVVVIRAVAFDFGGVVAEEGFIK
jgi:hypothetical protein